MNVSIKVEDKEVVVGSKVWRFNCHNESHTNFKSLPEVQTYVIIGIIFSKTNCGTPSVILSQFDEATNDISTGHFYIEMNTLDQSFIHSKEELDARISCIQKIIQKQTSLVQEMHKNYEDIRQIINREKYV